MSYANTCEPRLPSDSFSPIAVSLHTVCSTDTIAHDRDLTLCYGHQSTRFGPALMATAAGQLCQLHFLDSADDTSAAIARLQQQWPQATLIHDPATIQTWGDRVRQAMTADRAPSLPLMVRGTPFQTRVWQALSRIPFGSLTTYHDLAIAIGQPQAVRAVGSAVGRNPIAYLIPCHRVIRKNGDLGGYRWGLARKSALLDWEATRRPQTSL